MSERFIKTKDIFVKINTWRYHVMLRDTGKSRVCGGCLLCRSVAPRVPPYIALTCDGTFIISRPM